MIDQFIDYYGKAKKMQELKFQGYNWTKQDVNDDLVWNIPIYDVVNRRFAAFSSFLEAIKKRDQDPKGNGIYFSHVNKLDNYNFIMMCYLFRLCGSGINYIPKTKDPWGTHGFGNFWLIKDILENRLDVNDWITSLPEKGFCDVKGYLLPMIKGGMYNYIKNFSIPLVEKIMNFINTGSKVGIKEVVDFGNKVLMSHGYKRQNFVLTAFSMDLAEYFPQTVDRDSDVYVGSNAKKCLKMILPKEKTDKALKILCELTNNVSKPYDMEDVACDFIRYKNNFQSEHHIKYNNGIKYYNNVLK